MGTIEKKIKKSKDKNFENFENFTPVPAIKIENEIKITSGRYTTKYKMLLTL